MQLVEDDPLQPLEERTRLAMGEKQRKLLGRGQKDVGGPLDLPGTLVAGRIAGPRLDPDRQFHLPDGRLEIAGDVDRERLQGRDVEGVEAIASGLPFGQLRKLDKARQEAGERLSRTGRRDEEDGTSRGRLFQQGDLVLARLPAAAFEPAVETLGQSNR